jgi:hypothetical protein
VQVILSVGQRRPAYLSAEGLVLLAGLSPDVAKRSVPPQTVSLTATLGQVKKDGLLQIKAEETTEIAYPICPDGYRPTVALLAVVPTYRWQPTKAFSNLLRQTAARLSYRLGAPVYQPYGQTTSEPVGPTTPLSRAEISEFLKGAWGARLACVRTDGTPHVVPLWYEWDGHDFWVTASPNANWGEYIRQYDWVSLAIDEPWPPLRRVLILGHTQPVANDAIPGGIAGLRQRLAARYLGRGATMPEAQNIANWQAFRITPKKTIGQRGLGG